MIALDREVRDVMTPGVVTISADASVSRVRDALAAHRVNAVLVVERHGGRPLGWITARGLLAQVLEETHHRSAGQAICEPPTTVSPSASIKEAADALLAVGTSHLLVAHGQDCMPEGVVSALDVVGADYPASSRTRGATSSPSRRT